MTKEYAYKRKSQQVYQAEIQKESQQEQEKNIAQKDMSTNVLKHMEKRLMSAFLSRHEKDIIRDRMVVVVVAAPIVNI
jgi:hypothetical protein